MAQRVAAGQTNRPPTTGWADYRAIAARNLFTLFNAVVFAASVALFALDDLRSAWAVSAMAILNGVMSLAQEIRAKRHLDTLAILGAAQARVRRDGIETPISADDIVLGDCLAISAGDGIIADGVLLQAAFLEVDEALLTGESEPVPRGIGDRLLAGSFCVAGEGHYRVDRVGADSFANRTSARARQYRFAPSPLQRTLATLVRVLTLVAVALCAVYVSLYYRRDFPATELWQMIAATMTSMVPQGLVLMATLALTLGAVSMGAKGAVVQRLNAVESMASLDILCMDKTGTLTTGELKFHSLRGFDGVEGSARESLRAFAHASRDADNSSIRALRVGLGDPPGDLPECPDRIPFQSRNRYSAVRIRGSGCDLALALGAIEAVIPFLSPEDAGRVRDLAGGFSAGGLRILLFADAALPGGSPEFAGTLEGYRLVPRAIVLLEDELRAEAKGVLDDLAARGIEFKILSGDNPETVRALVERLNVVRADRPGMTGAAWDQSIDKPQAAATHGVFGRVTPEQKLAIVNALQSRGHRVGMLGDGVNDILAIAGADLGIAMGTGSRAARTAAGLVLETDDFALLPAAFNEGGAILRKLRQVAKLLLLKNAYTLFLIVVAVGLLGFDFPYLPQQVTLLNLLTLGGPVFLIVFDRRPRSEGAGPKASFLRDVCRFSLISGSILGGAGLLIWLLGPDDLAVRRTLLLSGLIAMGLGSVHVVVPGEIRLAAWSAFAGTAYLAVMYFPLTAFVFALEPLSFGQWANIAAVAVPAVLSVRYAARHS